ncbi:nuclear transport factor 2 family protein [Streptomyces sp. PSKA54]|uniref:Nuclear transport factor 2 family protein n=1 Tax=Streptomyces himalayensis subsp. aureolus TaxID=2758039 RepID=A0A7W2D999_9ACTN|nr:nuclear transport factor 2 family protein [Streptomyces himalayensis]MBA4867096.1 nuclear transport factor 2 family protein [Streptomyces himalayensis subsp. aureolus]
MSDYRPVDATTRVEIEQLIAEMLYRLDHNQADTTWELYTEDGVSVGPMGDMDREAMKAWGARRAQQTDLVGRHFIGGIRLVWDGEEVEGTVQYLTFRDTNEPQTQPASVGEFRERYRKADGQWRFARREIVPVFGGKAAAAHAARLAGREGSAQ